MVKDNPAEHQSPNNCMERIAQRYVRQLLRSKIRGRGRAVSLLARTTSYLQKVPIQIRGYRLYVDLRDTTSQVLFAGSPWQAAPFESEEQVIMSRFVDPGSRVFDVGANIGLHTVLLAFLVGPTGVVFAFEPNPKLLPCLQQTVAGMPNVCLLPFALSDAIGSTDFYVPGDHPSLGSLADWTRRRISETAIRLVCEQRTIDDLVRQQLVPVPDFIKCDVEGAELKVFRGARETLDRTEAPSILFESNVYTSAGFGINKIAARNFLASLPHPRYEFFAINQAGELTDSMPEADHANLLAVPRSKLHKVGKSRLPLHAAGAIVQHDDFLI
jgi:FkbM family methyltransferase